MALSLTPWTSFQVIGDRRSSGKIAPNILYVLLLLATDRAVLHAALYYIVILVTRPDFELVSLINYS